MRIPLTVEEGQQFAWVTRPAVAQSLADEALQLSNNRSTEVRTLALLAWRATHRAPRFLNQRREVSAEALDLAQNLRHPSHQVNAAVAMNVDALESGDRPLSDQALAVARWVAERDGNPRLKWQAFCLAAGLAHLDGDTESAERFRVLAKTVGEKAQLPGWMGAEFLFQGELVISHDEVEPLSQYLFDETFPGLANPIGRSCIAYCFARTGDTATAERYIRRAMRQLDDESSYLLLTTRMTATALLVGAPDLLRDLGEVLTPWVDHIAVDSNGWWCDGPVSGWLAEIHHALGHSEQAQILAEQARVVARALNDQRTMQRLDRLTQKFRVSITTQPTGGLSERELRVLTMLATGSTNAEIARQLSYSVSTIRDDTTSIYRKLQVKGRAEAVGRATQLGFIADPR
jgi:DNA-binding CsgD family transcriptional regulator